MSDYKYGQWNAICDCCGFKFKSNTLRERWDGLMVCPTCFETRHPQDFLKVKPDAQSIPWSRPRPVDTFIYVPSFANTTAYVGFAQADISQAGVTFGYTYLELVRYLYCNINNSKALPSIGVAGCTISGKLL